MSTRSGAAREPLQQQQLPDDIEKENAAILNNLPPGVWQEIVSWLEKENAAVLDKLPREVWAKIVGSIGGENYFPFALTCRYFRDLHKEVHPSCSVKETNPLATFTYLSTHDYDDDGMGFSASIQCKYPLLPPILLCLLSLTTLCHAQTVRMSPGSLLTI